MIQVLTNNHYDAILDLFENATTSVKIVSPFLSLDTAKKLCEFVREKGMDCSFITRLYIQDMLDKANNLEALRMMKDAGVKVYAVKGLHTKLYLFDGTTAVMGSANFTSSGLKTNIELSLQFEDEPEVTKELVGYFENLQTQVEDCGGEITDEMLEKAQEIYDQTWKSTVRYDPDMYQFSWNRNKNLEGKDKKTGEHKFTWQPHGAQFTVLEHIPADRLHLQVRHPAPIDKDLILKSTGYDKSWVFRFDD